MGDQQGILNYNGSRWEGEDVANHQRIWMDDATFQRHAWALLDAQRTYQPLLGDLDRAREHCRRLEYWQGCTDPGVHMMTPDTSSDEGNKKRR
jgi:hypothetical protein